MQDHCLFTVLLCHLSSDNGTQGAGFGELDVGRPFGLPTCLLVQNDIVVIPLVPFISVGSTRVNTPFSLPPGILLIPIQIPHT